MNNEDIRSCICDECAYMAVSESKYPCNDCIHNGGTINRFERMTANDFESIITDTKEFDEIKKASHYNLNKSGIECADITQYFDNCRGQAIQYIWRCEHKGAPIKDLKKAIYWLERKIKLYEKQGLKE